MRLSKIRNWWRRVTEPHWCRERHVTLLESLRETAIDNNRIHARIREMEGAGFRNAACVAFQAVEHLARAIDLHGAPRVREIALPWPAFHATRGAVRAYAETYVGNLALIPSGLALCGVQIVYRKDLPEHSFLVTFDPEKP